MPRVCAFALVSLVCFCAHTRAGEPLHTRIDAHIEAKAKADGIPLSALADDAEFVRRVFLDFAGRVPVVGETKAFLADPSADKRMKLIDQLLAAPGYTSRMTDAVVD